VPKSFIGGTHRAVSPEETFNRVKPLMGLLGITRIADVTGLDCIGIPVAMAFRPNARSLAVSPGKGLDLAAAKTSAVMESLEGWHAERILLPLVLGSYNELRFERRIAALQRLPQRSVGELTEHTRMLWIEGRNLLSDTTSYVPFEVVHTNYTLPLPPSSGAFVASSNGLASGNHLLEAISHAICELVERDATTLWHGLDRPARAQTLLDLSTVDDPACVMVLEQFERAGVAVGVWETTSDLGIPAFRCIITDKDPSPLRPHLPGVGAGCHPTREVALLRALTEAAQVRLTLISGARDDMGLAQYTRAADHDLHRGLVTEITNGANRDFRKVNSFVSDTFDDDLRWQLERLSAAGIDEVIAIDLTKPAIGIPVVRVVIPGLEGIHDAPGYRGGARYQKQLQAGKN